MAGISWLHLSDWHQRGNDFNRTVVRDALIKDIKKRSEINLDLEKIDFVIFSGDLAYSGKKQEYETVKEHLLDPVLKATSLSSDKLFIVPGNHDIDLDLFELLPAATLKPFDSEEQVQNWLTNERKRDRLLAPFEAFRDFVADYTGQSQPDYVNICKLNTRACFKTKAT